MHLFELTDIQRPRRGDSVPEWALGCFRRRCITYFTGASDETTEVVWMQSRGLTADYRRVPGRLKLAGVRALAELSLFELLELAQVEGGFARTRWDGEAMHWSDWVSFQTHAKWPEAGLLERVGNCLIEFAPSGAYVEDWRVEPCEAGPLLGLGLLEEKELDTLAIRHRGGGLIVCGRHASFVRGRPAELPAVGRLCDYVRAHAQDPERLRQVFTFDAAYGTAVAPGQEDFTVTLATLPWREGQSVIQMDGFSYDAEHDHVVQRVHEQGHPIERRFTIDTLERQFRGSPATVPSAEGRAWLDREADTLLQPARHRSPSIVPR